MTRPAEKCSTCQRGAAYFEGCSHVECPKRKPVTAQAIGDTYGCHARGVLFGLAANGGVRREPTTRGDE
jgi:hypothetical protein